MRICFHVPSAMACIDLFLSCSLRRSFASPFKFASSSSYSSVNFVNFMRFSTSNRTASNSTALSTNNFTWDDVVRIGQSESEPSDLTGFFDKVKACNRNMEKQCEFVPFVVEGQVVGYVHEGFAANLRRFQDVFSFPESALHNGDSGCHITLQPELKSREDRTSAVADVIKFLGPELIPGIRNELYPVKSAFGEEVFFSLERAAAPYFGIKAYGVHMNGYVEKEGQKFLWLGKRSQAKPTFPGMLDHLVAGGLPHGIPCGENMMKECEEEAGIPMSISKQVKPVGAVSYMDIDGYKFKRDILFCYDLKLPKDFVPKNQDGEVESFHLIPVPLVANVIKRTQFFKTNCSLVIIDFFFRHGFVCPDYAGYLKLLQSVRSGDCS